MDEISEILAGAERFRRTRTRYAMATIVGTQGSTYRRSGAKLLVSHLGETVGAISGGCLEAEVAGVAGEVISGRGPRIVEVDHRAHDEAVWGWGLGCSGSMTLFVEPGDDPTWLDTLATVRDLRRPAALITVLTSTMTGLAPGSHIAVDSSGRSDVHLGNAAGPVLDRARHALAGHGSGMEELIVPDGRIRVFVEVPEVPVHLLVCGAGRDAIPLLRMATGLEWSSVQVHRPQQIRDLAIDPWTYAVVMTHHYVHDREYLSALLDTPTPYIGVLGPRARLARLLDDLDGEGKAPTAERRNRIFGPAGLDIGAEGPGEIAAAIVGEILSVRRGRAGGRLRDRPGRIHQARDDAVETPAHP